MRDESMKKMLVVLVVLTLIGPCLVFATGNVEKEGAAETYSWKFASAEIEGDFMTVFAEKFADEMRSWSGGSIDITVFPFGTLGQERDIHELAQNNTVQFVFSDFGWISGFVPQAQVFALGYLWPREKSQEVLDEVIRNGKAVKLLESKFRERKLQPLGYLTEGWQVWTSNKPIQSIGDIRGFKMRTMSSKILVENFKAFGASPTPMDFGEVYSGLQLGIIDGQCNPLWVGYSMKFYEVQNYFTTTYDNLFVGIPCVNSDLYDSLPKETQEKMKEVWDGFIDESVTWVQKKNEDYMSIMLKERPVMKFEEFNDRQIAPFKERAQTVYPIYEDVGGAGADQILAALLDDIKKAKAKFGVK
jgi:tripartite ATP-independent transporter DctP family solute receptor